MGNNKGSNIFLGVIGVATLLVAIIGATFAFFGAEISSPEGAVSAQSATLSLGYQDVTDGLNTNMIPAEYWIAEYAAMEQKFWTEDERDEFNEGKEDGEQYKGNLQCIDDNGNEVCGVYTFTIGNPSFTTAQNLYGSISIVENGIADLWFRIYDEEGEEVVEPTAFSEAVDNVISLDELNQRLLPSSSDTGKTIEQGFDAAKPLTYTLVGKENASGKMEYNRRTYTLVLWIEETQTDQTETSGNGAMFAASINFSTASGTSGVTGVIYGVNKGADDSDNPDGTNYPAAG